MCFQPSLDVYKAPTKHFFHLRLECKGKLEVDCYHWIISYELDKKRDELACDEYKWMKPEIISDAEKVLFEDILE